MAALKEYADALFMLTEELGTSERVLSELNDAKDAILENKEYVSLLETPALPMEEKLRLVDQAFASFDESLLSFLKILTEKRLIRYIGDVLRDYITLFDESRGILRVEAISAVALTDAEIAAIERKLSAKCEKTAIVRNTVKPEILGGITLRYSGIQLDGSIKSRLEKLEASLKNVIV